MWSKGKESFALPSISLVYYRFVNKLTIFCLFVFRFGAKQKNIDLKKKKKIQMMATRQPLVRASLKGPDGQILAEWPNENDPVSEQDLPQENPGPLQDVLKELAKAKIGINSYLTKMMESRGILAVKQSTATEAMEGNDWMSFYLYLQSIYIRKIQ